MLFLVKWVLLSFEIGYEDEYMLCYTTLYLLIEDFVTIFGFVSFARVFWFDGQSSQVCPRSRLAESKGGTSR